MVTCPPRTGRTREDAEVRGVGLAPGAEGPAKTEGTDRGQSHGELSGRGEPHVGKPPTRRGLRVRTHPAPEEAGRNSALEEAGSTQKEAPQG